MTISGLHEDFVTLTDFLDLTRAFSISHERIRKECTMYLRSKPNEFMPNCSKENQDDE